MYISSKDRGENLDFCQMTVKKTQISLQGREKCKDRKRNVKILVKDRKKNTNTNFYERQQKKM